MIKKYMLFSNSFQISNSESWQYYNFQSTDWLALFQEFVLGSTPLKLKFQHVTHRE